jgi:hypothetical protein
MNRKPRRAAGKRSLAQFAREEARKAPAPFAFACFKTSVLADRKRSRKGVWRHNLTTTTATGFTNANDWMAKAMGQGPSFTFATAVGAATATGATSLTNSGAAFPTAGQALAGQMVVAWVSTTVMVWGMIQSNTATVLTVDQWYNGASATAAAGTTPPSTAPYIILPGQAPAPWLAVTQNATAPTTADTTLTSELATADWVRAVGTYAHTAAATTYTLVHLWTSTSTVTINKEAVFGGANVTGGGVMPFESAEPSPPTLVSGDTLQNTITITV